MRKVFDYCYYRLASYYIKRKTDIPYFSGLIHLSTIVALTIHNLYSLFSYVWFGYEYMTKVITLSIYFGCFAIFLPIYGKEQKYDKIKERFISESEKNKKRNGFLLIAYQALLAIIIIIMATYKTINR